MRGQRPEAYLEEKKDEKGREGRSGLRRIKRQRP